MKRDLVYISPITWDFLWQRPQQLCVGFSKKGIKVLYVEPPVSLLGFIKRPQKIANILKKRVFHENLEVYTPIGLLPMRFNLFSKLNEKLIHFCIQKKIKSMQLTDPLLITCDPQVTGAIARFEKNTICYDCCDEVTAFPHIPKNIVEKENMLLQISNLVITTSENLEKSKRKFNKNVFLVPNGAEVADFNKVDEIGENMRPKELVGVKPPIIGYYGALAAWVDFQLIREVAEKRPGWTFVLVGLLMTKLPPLPANCIIVPPQNYQDLPKFVRFFDVCMIPFARNELILNTNPVKLYEYLAAGKPVVSTRMPEVERYREHVSIVDNAAEFEQAVESLLKEDNPDLKVRRRQLAAENSWQKRCESILEILGDEK